MKNIALTGGGTAGHVMPNMALLPCLKDYFDNVIYIAGDGMEQKIVPSYNVPFYSTTVVKLNRDSLWSNAKVPFRLMKGTAEAKKILQRNSVGIVFSKGGYASLPTVIAAREMRIPVIVHESDFSMGVANKFASKLATRILTSFPETPKGEWVGSPIRDEIFKGSDQKALEDLGMKRNGKKFLLVFGGSSGAEFINKVMQDCHEEVEKEWNIIHLTGEKPAEIPESESYKQIKYTQNIADYYALSDAVIMRGGANSLAEVTALGLPCVCIPLPKGTSRGDQVENAKSYAKRGLITMLEQEKADKNTIIALTKYLKTLETKPRASESTNKRITEIIVEEYEKSLT